MIKFEVRTLDIWGNESDGYEVNDSFNQGVIELADNYSDKAILQAIDSLMVSSIAEHLDKADIDDEGDFIEIRYKSNGMPVFHLYMVEEE